MATILDLPPELISQTATHLSPSDFFAARLATRYIESSLFSQFGTRFFRKKGYLITTRSTAVLSAVSNHPELRKYVQHIWFNPDLWTFVKPKCTQHKFAQQEVVCDEHETSVVITEYDHRSEQQRQQSKVYKTCINDRANLLHRRKLEQALSVAFAKLPNLTVIGMRRSEDYYPWGWRQLKDAVGEDPRVLGSIPERSSDKLSHTTYLFIAIINALAATHTEVMKGAIPAKIKRLYTDAIEIDNVSPGLLPPEKLNPALKELLYLEINASRAMLKPRPGRTYFALKHQAECGHNLVRLFQAAPKIRELGLQIFPNLRETGKLEESYTFLTFSRLSTQIQLPHLTRFKLERVTTSAQALQDLLQQCQTNLTSLKIRDVRLVSGGKIKYSWQSVFQFLHTHCVNLEYVLFYHLRHRKGGISFVPDVYSTGPPFDEMNQVVAPEDGALLEEMFATYEHIALEVIGREAVRSKLADIVERHWHKGVMLTYQMDEELWHTDTSDEDW